MLTTQLLSRASPRTPALRLHLRSSTTQLQPLSRHSFSSSAPAMSLGSYLVTSAELDEALKSSVPSSQRIIPICAAWFLPNDPQKRTGQQVFEQSHIPNARFFDLDGVKDADSPYPHMLPTAEVFAEAMSDLGLRRDDRLVVYDSAEQGLFSAPRVAWTLRVFGHERVHVLNNYRLWKEGGYPVETGSVTEIQEKLERTKYPVPTFCADKIIAYREVKDIAKRRKEGDESEKIQVVDVRSRGRFDGTSDEPRPGLSSGHMPGAINIPFAQLLDSKTGAMLPPDRLKSVFEASGLDPKKPIVSTCGTGVMAAACNLALEQADFGRKDERRVYDGSWTEYALRVGKDEGLIVKDY